MVEKIPFTAPLAADVTQRWVRALARYREPDHYRSIFEIAVTLMPFLALWALAWAAIHFGHWEYYHGIVRWGISMNSFFVENDARRLGARSTLLGARSTLLLPG